jgi:hypothetical protein
VKAYHDALLLEDFFTCKRGWMTFLAPTNYRMPFATCHGDEINAHLLKGRGDALTRHLGLLAYGNIAF